MPYDIKPLSCEPKKLKKAAQSMGCGSHAQPCRVAAKYIDAFTENIRWAHVARLHHDYAR